MKRTFLKRMMSLLLAAAMLLTVLPTVALAAEPEKTNSVTFQEISQEEFGLDDLSLDSAKVQQEPEAEVYSARTQVRVSIVLNAASTVEAGFSTMEIAQNSQAQAYRSGLETAQQSLTQRISQNVLGGQALDVVWNLTLAANVISANVPYGKIDAIKALPGVKDVVLETVYEPMVASVDGYEPTMASAVDMTGANTAWESGYTGAGSRVAIIDTGLDTDHQSVNANAFLHAIEEDEETYGTTYDLMDEADIAEVLPQLNIYKGFADVNGNFLKDEKLTADVLYRNAKVAFGYNYIDRDLDITHDNDGQGAHGSHVAGIASANRYVETGDGQFADASETVFMTGAAPDAQLLIMKVFGKNGGAYDSDYMAAIEDAIVLGADVVNLSLGSATPGFSTSDYYQEIMDSLSETDTVVSISSGNSGAWAENSVNGYLYGDDVSFQTGGSPGSFTNAFTVASVNNDGMVGYGFDAYGENIVYTETKYYNPYFRYLDTSEDGSGTEYEYIFLDGIGSADEYKAIINEMGGENIFKDKIVIVARGEISFADKHKASYSTAKAKACIIYNNVDGAAINMVLSTSAYNACVGITKANGDFIRENSTPVLGSDGEVLYYTGKLTVGSAMGAVSYHSDFYEMSSFSSWGVPGNLSLKPEITAPGGAIYSIDGSVGATDQYVVMSGTSMAAPHITGLTALVAQYVRENGLAETLDISARTLIQSLLMSTATPIVDGSTGLPYPVIQQGTGLANAVDAMNARSYILVNGQEDGKVKAELGDDPDRTGVYTFDYTLYNMTNEAQSYALDGQVYTQDAFTYGDTSYLDYTLRSLDAVVSFAVDGKAIASHTDALEGYDFNGDGQVTRADGQALLDYAVGNLDALHDSANADLNGDGRITAYDAELFLDLLGKCNVLLPANGCVTVTVTIALTEAQKAELNEIYPNGAYIEAYITADPEADAEGVLASGHSIPVLAYYGGWDEPSMFDRLDYTEALSGNSQLDSYLPIHSSGIPALNYVGLTDGNGDQFYLGGNRFAADDEYLPERNAIRSNAGDGIDSFAFCMIRAAGGLRAAITDVETGQVYAYEEFDHVYPAFYYTNAGSWYYYNQSVVPEVTEGNWMVNDLATGEPLPEGTTVELMVQAAPEYFLNDDGVTVNWDEIDPDNTTLSMQVTVDNTAPVVSDIAAGTAVNVETGAKDCDYIDVTVQDNEYVAAAILMTPGESKVFVRQSANQTVRDEEVTIRLDVTGIFGSEFKVAVVDYAGNAVYYLVRVSEPYNGQTGNLIATTNGFQSAGFVSFDSDTNYDAETLGNTYYSIYGITYGDGYLFFNGNTSSNRTDSLYVMDYPNFDEEPTLVGEMDYNNYFVYNPDDGKIYTVIEDYEIDWDTFERTVTTTLQSIDVADAQATVVANIHYDNETMILSDIAYSVKEKAFYLVGSEYAWEYDANRGFEVMAYKDNYLFRIAMPVNGGEITLDKTNAVNLGHFSSYPDLNIALDETGETSVLYILSGNNTYCDVFTYDFATGKSTMTGRTDFYSSLLFIGEDVPNNITRDTATSIALSVKKLDVFAGGSKTLSAEVGPWCLADQSVTWTSSDPSVAAVDQNGCITGVKAGTATITATAATNPAVSASCTVNVIGTNFEMTGIGAKADGSSVLFSGSLETGGFTEIAAITDAEGANIPVESATMDGGKLLVQDNVLDAGSGEGYRFHIVDPETGVETKTLPVNSNNYQDGSLLFGDLAYDSYQNIMFGLNGAEKLFFSTDPELNDLGSSWYNMSYGFSAMTKSRTYMSSGTKYTYFYAMSTDATWLVRPRIYFDSFFQSWSGFFEYFEIDGEILAEADENGVYQDSLVYDAVTQTPILFHYTEKGTEVYALSLDENLMIAQPIYIGTIEDYENISAISVSYAGSAAALAANETMELPAPKGEPVLAVSSEETNAANGSLHAIPNAAPSAGNDDGIVTVTIRAEAPARSGMLEIALGEGLELVNVTSPALLSSWKLDGSSVTFGYAGTETIETGGVLAVLTLTQTGSEETSVTVTETERSGKNPGNAESVVIPGQGEADVYTVIFDSQGGSPVEPQYVKAGEYAVAPLAPTKDGYRFCGWYTDPDCTNAYSFGWAVNADLTLYAKWAQNSSTPDPDVDPPIPVNPSQPNGSAGNTGSKPTFVDVPESHWAFEAVEFVAGNGWFNGVDNTHFAPNGKLTRAMLVTVLWRMEGKPAAAYQGTFSDVPNGQWYTTAVEWAAANGVVNGTGHGFDPDGYVTREQIATILWRLEGKPAASGSLAAYPDGAEVSEYAKDAMAWAVETGLFKGDGQGRLNPCATATRAEAAALLQRYAQ